MVAIEEASGADTSLHLPGRGVCLPARVDANGYRPSDARPTGQNDQSVDRLPTYEVGSKAVVRWKNCPQA